MAFPAQHITISIERPPGDVHRFVAEGSNLPRWASGLSRGSIRRGESDGEWIADSPMGRVRVKLAPANDLGVLDHTVTLPSGEAVYNPMRVVANDRGSEVTFTLFRRPGVSDEELAADARTVAGDLATLKRLLEGAA